MERVSVPKPETREVCTACGQVDGYHLQKCRISELQAEVEMLRGEIENAAYERAAEACERLISGDGICAADGVWIHDCADAIRALIKEKK